MSKVQVDTIDTRSGTSTMQIGSTNTSTINIGVSGDTVNIPSGVTIANAGTATGFGQDNSPAFYAYSPQSYQAISSSTWTTINTTNEAFDTANAFDTSTLKFTPQVAGKYFLYGNAVGDGNWGRNLVRLRISKNNNSVGGDEIRNHITIDSSDGIHVSGLIALNGSSDFVQLAIYHEIGSSYNLINQQVCNYFGGFLVTTT